MTDEATLLALADRIEAAEGPDRELDAAIALAIRYQDCLPCDFNGIKARTGGILNAPAFTASLDAAMTLVPEGWTGVIDLTGAAKLIDARYPNREVRALACATPALALCAAALRARAANPMSDKQPIVDELREALKAAYEAGAHDVHLHLNGKDVEREADFTEAATDYAAFAIERLLAKAGAA